MSLTNKVLSRMSAARRNAEALMPSAKKTESPLKIEQERERQALSAKTARLRELRLAKEEEAREAAGPLPAAAPKAKRVRRRTF